MADPLRIYKDDLQPYYRARATSGDDVAIPLTGATIYCTMKNIKTGERKINKQTAGIDIDTPLSGDFQYKWVSGDTDVVGYYNIEFEINPSSGGKFTFPPPHEKAVVEIMQTQEA